MPAESTFVRMGIDEEFYETLLDRQKGLCAICLKPDARLVIDHAHDCCWGAWSCGLCVRGLLCGRCNLLVGYIETTPPEHLDRARRYTEGQNPRGYVPHLVASVA